MTDHESGATAALLGERLRRLTRARARAVWLRSALWGWCFGVFAWLMPIGGWSAAALSPTVLAFATCAIACCGIGLLLLYRATSETAAVRAALDDIPWTVPAVMHEQGE